MKFKLKHPYLLGLISTESLQPYLARLAVDAASRGADLFGEGREAEEEHEGGHDDDEEKPVAAQGFHFD